MSHARLVTLCLVLVGARASAQIYWVEAGDDSIQRSNLDGSQTSTLWRFRMQGCRYMAIDAAAQKIYWADYTQDKLGRANLDGSGPEFLVDTIEPEGIAVDPAGGKMYWVTRPGNLSRANLDGSGLEVLRSDLVAAIGVAVAPSIGRVFWTDATHDAIISCNFSGGDVDTLISDLIDPIGLAIDDVHGWVFWTELGADRVGRCDLDGDNDVILAEQMSFFNMRGIAVDPQRNLLFFTSDLILGRMYRLGTDGSNPQLVIQGENYGPVGVASDPSTGDFYWWHDGDGVFYRTDPMLGGKEIALAGMASPNHMVLHEASSRLFWADGAHIFGVDTDGDNFLRISSGHQGSARGIGIAQGIGKLYWITEASLYRSNLDGSVFEDLDPACNLLNPQALVVDEVAGKVYWTRSNGILQRANLDGSSCEDFPISGLSFPTALAIRDGKLLIGDDGRDQLLRYDLAGAQLDTLVSPTPNILGVTAGALGNKVYWSDSFHRLRRANLLDGSAAETLLQLRNAPWGMVTAPVTTPTRLGSWSEFKSRF